MLCIENRTLVTVGSWRFFPTELWVTFELRIRSSVPHFNGLATASVVKENKRRYFLLPSTKKATKKRKLKYIHILGPYLTWFTLNEKFIAY